MPLYYFAVDLVLLLHRRGVLGLAYCHSFMDEQAPVCQ